MNAVVRILDWPIEAEDALPLALWDAGSIARATGGQDSTFFQVAGADIDSRDVTDTEKAAWNFHFEDFGAYFELNYERMLLAEAWLRAEAEYKHGGVRKNKA